MEENKYSKEDLDNQKKVEQSEMSIKAILQDQLRALKEMVGTKTESVDLSKEVLSLHRETNQFIGENFDKTIEMMLYKNLFMKPENQNGLIEFFSSWKINYLSWKRSKLPKLIIKYEDLKMNSTDNFLKILNFLKKFDSKIQIDEKKIDRISQKCEFDNLQKLEKKFGFDERKGNSLFFRNAKNEEWKDVLTSSQLDLLNNEFQNEMKDLGYL